MFVHRILKLKEILKQKSCFLFGPRQTGKSTLIKNTLSEYPVYNLLDSPTLLKLSRSPERIEQESANAKIIIIDEIQKMPSLLNEVQKLIEKKGINFLLTGSSARKLRRGGVNLLGGRARSRSFHPFIYKELKEKFDLKKALLFGLVPSIFFSSAPYEDLEAYAGDYLKEEIAAEGIVRNIPSFSRFLDVAALCNGQILNFTEISNDAQVARTTVHEYFQILIDTLIATELPAWRKTKTRKATSTSKFYFFDIGIVNFLQRRKDLPPKTSEFGTAFEAYIFHELKTFLDYNKLGDLHYWKSKSGFEVDFIVADSVAVEVKAKENVADHDLKGIRALEEEKLFKQYIVVSMEKQARQIGNISILPWQFFLDALWEREYV